MFTDPLIGSILAGYWLWSHLQSEAVTPEPSQTFETFAPHQSLAPARVAVHQVVVLETPTPAPSLNVTSIILILTFFLAATVLLSKLIITLRQREHKAIDESHISDSTTEPEINIPEFDFTVERPNKIVDLEEHIAVLHIALKKEKHEANVNAMIRCAAEELISPNTIPDPVSGQDKDIWVRHMNEEELKEIEEDLDRTYRSAMDDDNSYSLPTVPYSDSW